ncbi:hypothetical protein J3B01_003015 [Coemansia erecta]|nr:hypothetical protein J3B01_003015 [Coemansia erecta]
MPLGSYFGEFIGGCSELPQEFLSPEYNVYVNDSIIEDFEKKKLRDIDDGSDKTLELFAKPKNSTVV